MLGYFLELAFNKNWVGLEVLSIYRDNRGWTNESNMICKKVLGNSPQKLFLWGIRVRVLVINGLVE